MGALVRQGHFLGAKLRSLRKRNGLTLEELSARCVQIDAASAPSVSYLSMIENGQRLPSDDMLALLAGIFGKSAAWFLDQNTELGAEAKPTTRGGVAAMPLEPGFLFSHDLLRIALPELLSQTATTGKQFAQLLIRVWQETRHNDFPDIERAAEQVGDRRMPLSPDDLLAICKRLGLQVRWFDDQGKSARSMVRSRFEAPHTVWINKRLKSQEQRLKYELAFFAGHRIMHNGDGLISAHEATWNEVAEAAEGGTGMGPQDVLYAWRDFECSFFAAALMCPRAPFRRFLIREAHSVEAGERLGVTSAVMMRRMTSVSPYRHWHFFDAYPPGFLRAVYRANGIPLPWGNMSVVPDPCPRWAVFRMLKNPEKSTAKAAHKPKSQISIMPDGEQTRLYCCHSMTTRDAAGITHVLSVGVDLSPALSAQGYDEASIVQLIADSCRKGGGDAPIPTEAKDALRTVSRVLNIGWIADALSHEATTICSRSNRCPRSANACH
jgi:transcriptional regulator with XRE-family HTH domain/predicted transcriptional regulator